MWFLDKNFLFSLSNDSSKIGSGYVFISFLGGVLGFSFSVIMSMELSVPFSVVEEGFYYVSITSHGLLMLFYFLTTLASGFSNYLIPTICCVSDMYFDKLNVFTLWLVLSSFLFVFLSLVVGEGVMAGWTLYTPLSSSPYSDDFSVDLLILGIHIFTMSSIFGAINNLVTIFMSCDLESFLDFSPFIWSFIVTSILIVFAMPALSCSLTMLLFDSSFNTYYFNSEFGGDPVLYQAMFWFFGHPEVYILMLPVFGVVSHVLMCLSGGSLYNTEGIIFSMVSLGVLSFFVWGHHMVTMGWGVEVSSFFMCATVVISVPTGVKVFSWLFNLFFCLSIFSLSIGFVVCFLLYFCFGGLTGFFLANSNLDFFLHDTWWVTGHFHQQLSMASFFGFFSGLVFFFSDLFDVKKFQVFGVCFYGLLFLMSNILFVPFYVLGLVGLPSSVCCYPFEYFFWFYISSLGFLGVWVSFIFLNCWIVLSMINFVLLDSEFLMVNKFIFFFKFSNLFFLVLLFFIFFVFFFLHFGFLVSIFMFFIFSFLWFYSSSLNLKKMSLFIFGFGIFFLVDFLVLLTFIFYIVCFLGLNIPMFSFIYSISSFLNGLFYISFFCSFFIGLISFGIIYCYGSFFVDFYCFWVWGFFSTESSFDKKIESSSSKSEEEKELSKYLIEHDPYY